MELNQTTVETIKRDLKVKHMQLVATSEWINNTTEELLERQAAHDKLEHEIAELQKSLPPESENDNRFKVITCPSQMPRL